MRRRSPATLQLPKRPKSEKECAPDALLPKGWHFLENNAIYNGNPDDSEQAIENFERLRRRGATHFVFTKNTFWWSQSYPDFVSDLNKQATLVEATPEFEIYRFETLAR